MKVKKLFLVMMPVLFLFFSIPLSAISSDILFSGKDKGIIIEYYKTHSSGLPPGLAKRGGKLPPGLEKHLQKNGKLPPGLQKKISPLPLELEKRLSPLPPRSERVIIGTHVIIYNRAENVILDIIKDVIQLKRDIDRL